MSDMLFSCAEIILMGHEPLSCLTVLMVQKSRF